ncbi:hypothetical protein FHS38_007002 [Streptomyces netropsis]|uniref:Uncharacterized protein n=1 Tax=Streptomyces netropsis TaxID=55404 RepID=A0A7W7LIX6_STRNE|nr:hypothetical protein [Streptomyces netropsis]GGR52564.1 hypothetical protein GCM10010219_67050 [Streptomyces netropsis]
MSGPEHEALESGVGGSGAEELAPDTAGAWVRGVDYVAGWREATGAVAALAGALASAGVEGPGVRLRASAGDDGSGVVRLELTVPAARVVAKLASDVAAGFHGNGDVGAYPESR